MRTDEPERDRDDKPGKNGGKLEPLTKVLEYRVGRKKMRKGRRKEKRQKKSPRFYSRG